MRSILILSALFITTVLFSQNAPTKNVAGFIENKGQIHNQDDVPRPDVRFVFPGEIKTILRENGFSYEWYSALPWKKGEDSADVKLLCRRIDVTFLNANTSPEIIPEEQQESVYNYYLNGTVAKNVHLYNAVLYKDLYPGIDIRFRVKDGVVKYDIIAHPGSDLSKVAFRYDGADKIALRDKKLILVAGDHELEESIPFSYQRNENGISDATVQFHLEKNVIHYAVSDYNAGQELVIDPTVSRLWGTFFGGNHYEYIYDLVLDAQQNISFVGWSNSTANVATSGAYQTTLIGSTDCILGKFDPAGQLLWATYFGGNDQEQAYEMDTDSLGNYYFTGFTESTAGMATPGAYQTVFGGGAHDAFVAKFDVTGQLAWCTYLGGTGADDGFNIKVTPGGGLYLAMETQSASGMASPGAFQATYGGGSSDAFVAHFSASGAYVWGTYYGGTAIDRFTGIDLNSAGQLVLSGQITSTGMATPGAYRTSPSGFDAWVCMFDTNGTRIWATYYGGTGTDRLARCGFTAQQDIVCAGSTSSIGLASPGAFQYNMSGTADLIIVVLNNAGNARVWASYLGGNSGESTDDLQLVDTVIYLSGSTTSETGLSSPGAFQPEGDPTSLTESDAFVAAISVSGTKIWATYFGHAEIDHGEALVVDTSGNVYLGGMTKSQSYFGTPGTYQPSPGSNSSYHDGFLEKLDPLSIYTGNVASPFCAGATINVSFTGTGYFGPTQTFEAVLSDSLGSFINYVVIGSITGTTSGTITCTIPASTVESSLYRIAVRSVDRNVFDQDNGSNLTIWEIPVVSFFLPFDFCLYAHWVPLDSVIPGGQPAGGVFTGPGVDANYDFTPLNAGVGIHNICYTYTDPHACVPPQSACWPVVVYAPLNATFGTIPPVCLYGGPVQLTQGAPTAPGIGVYLGPGVDQAGLFDPLLVGPGTYNLMFIYFDAGGCLPDTAYQTITVQPPPPTPVISWNGVILSSSIATGNQWYRNGSIIVGSTAQNYTPSVNGSHSVINTQGGCPSDTSNVIVITNVGVDEWEGAVQIAVTPNPSDGKFMLSISGAAADGKEVVVRDLAGRVVMRRVLSGGGVVNEPFDLGALGAGIYLLEVCGEEGECAVVRVMVR